MIGAFLVVLAFFLGYMMGSTQYNVSKKIQRIKRKVTKNSEILKTPTPEEIKVQEEKDFWSKIK